VETDEQLDIRNFGAAESAAPTANAAAIQSALDAASAVGGGTVSIPVGTFVSGTLWLRPRVELRMEEGAVLKASPNPGDYNAPDAYPENWGCPNEYWNASHFIIARYADGASITGSGTIDGNGDAFFDDEPTAYYDWMKPGASCWWNGIRWAKDKENLRPGQLVAFIKCRNVAVRGITIRNSPCWSLWFWGCEGVRVGDYTVRNGENDGNTDGIDIDCSRDVVLENADIDTGDDAIAIRASARESAPTAQGRLGLPPVTDGVRIRDCRLRSTSSVFRIGVGEGVIRNVLIEDVTCDRGGTAVNISTLYGVPEGHGTDIEDVTIRNCRFTECRVGAAVRSNGGDRLEFGIRRIRFENCTFGGLPPVLENAPGVRFPLDPSSVRIEGGI
jgi:polygalacturonase